MEYARLALDIRLWKWSCNHVLQLVQLRLTVYRNGWQAVLSVYGNGSATMSYSLCNCVLRFIEMAGKQFFRLWKWFCNYVLQLVQLCLTACATMSYSLCNHVLRFIEMAGKQFFPFMETVLEVVRAKISGYIKS